MASNHSQILSRSPASRRFYAAFIVTVVILQSFFLSAATLPMYGRWGIIGSSSGLWAMREDGSKKIQLATDPIVQFSVSPDRRKVAYLTHSDPTNLDFHLPFGYSLKILNLSTGKAVTVASLDMPGVTRKSPLEKLNQAYQALVSLTRGGITWSPGSTYLAYTSAAQGESADVYLYITTTGENRRLTQFQFLEGPAVAYALSFSPTGRDLFYNVAYQFGKGEEHWLAGAWVSDLHGSQVQVASSHVGSENLVAWMGMQNLLLSSSIPGCTKQNLRVVNRSSGQERVLWPGCYSDMIYDRPRGEIVLSLTPDVALFNADQHPGTWVFSISGKSPHLLTQEGFDNLLRGDLSASWYAYSQSAGLVAVQRDGKTQALFSSPPYSSGGRISLRPIFHESNSPVWFWSGEGLYAIQPGREPVQVSPFTPDRLWASPLQQGLFLFTVEDGENTHLFAFKAGEWKPLPVDMNIKGITGITWHQW